MELSKAKEILQEDFPNITNENVQKILNLLMPVLSVLLDEIVD